MPKSRGMQCIRCRSGLSPQGSPIHPTGFTSCLQGYCWFLSKNLVTTKPELNSELERLETALPSMVKCSCIYTVGKQHCPSLLNTYARTKLVATRFIVLVLGLGMGCHT